MRKRGTERWYPVSSEKPGPSRVLITGSRTWPCKDSIRSTLLRVIYGTDPSFRRITLVSGACPSGADRMAEEIADHFGWQIELHRADWDKYGKRAGFLRNSEMVTLGADVCVAFIHNGSRGGTMTADLAEKAGIPVVRLRLDDAPTARASVPPPSGSR